MKRVLLGVVIVTLIVGTLHAADKSPQQILGGKPAASSSGLGSYYDGHGRFAGRSTTSGSSTQLYDSQGRLAGRVDASKESTRMYDRSGSFAGRSSTSGGMTSIYESEGIV
jgi:YD repeat-containing protein